MSETTTGWGVPKYGNDATFAKKIRIKSTKPGEPDAVIIIRVLPPLHRQVKTGKWAIYKGQHFGYKVPSAKERNNPEKAFTVPFLCIEDRDFRSKIVNRRCGECENIDRVRKTLDEREAECKTKGMTDRDTEEFLKPLTSWLRDHNCDRKWHVNVKTIEGEFCTLLLNHKDEKKLLDMKIDQLKKDPQMPDPIAADQGVWWKITSSGQKINRKVDIEVLRETERHPQLGVIERVKPAPLTTDDFETAMKVFPDLEDNVKVLSSDQIDLLVACSGEPEEVEKIMNISTTVERSESSPTAQERPTPSLPPVRTAPKPAVAAPVAAPTPSPAEDDDEAAALKALGEARARKAAKAAETAAVKAAEVAKPVTTEPPPAKSALSDLTEADFLARYQPKQAK